MSKSHGNLLYQMGQDSYKKNEYFGKLSLQEREQSNCTWQPWPTSKLVLVTKKDSGWRTHCQGFQKLAKELEKVQKGLRKDGVGEMFGDRKNKMLHATAQLYIKQFRQGSHDPKQTSWW